MIEIKDVDYGYETPIFKGLDLTIEKNQKVAIVGPSGCGKSTLLKLMLGLVKAENGNVELANNHKMLGYMPQSNVLFDWYTVEENILLPLRLNQQQLTMPLEELLKQFGLDPAILNQYPDQLSGGMKSRVALIRAYIMSKEIIMLDEPLSKLDYITHQQIMIWLKMQLDKLKITMVLVTHNIEEAIELTDRIIVLDQKPANIIGDFKVDEYEKSKLKDQIIKKLKIEEEVCF